MTESSGTTSSGNGGIVGAVSRLGDRLIVALPPAFLLLVLLNLGFLALVLWFLDDQLDQRTKLVGQLLDHCLSQLGK